MRCCAQLYTAPPSACSGRLLAPRLAPPAAAAAAARAVIGRGRVVGEDGAELHDDIEELQAVHVGEALAVLVGAPPPRAPARRPAAPARPRGTPGTWAQRGGVRRASARMRARNLDRLCQ